MSRGNKWVPLDRYLAQEFKHINRKFSKIEAMYSHTLDIDLGNNWSINGYAKLWQWSRNKVKKFIDEIKTHSGHIKDTTRTDYRHPIHFIDKGLWEIKDTLGTHLGHIEDTLRYTTINPNPNPNPNNTKEYICGTFRNVLLSEDQCNKLVKEFNSSTSDKINALSGYIENFPKKGQKYKSHYATILSWDRKEKKENKQKTQSSGYSEPTPEKNYREGL